MKNLDDQLFPFLLELSAQIPALELSQARLENAGAPELARALDKLIQDAGTALSQEFGVDDGAHGPISGALESAFEKVTTQRLEILVRAAARLGDDHALNDLAARLPGAVTKAPGPASTSIRKSPLKSGPG